MSVEAEARNLRAGNLHHSNVRVGQQVHDFSGNGRTFSRPSISRILVQQALNDEYDSPAPGITFLHRTKPHNQNPNCYYHSTGSGCAYATVSSTMGSLTLSAPGFDKRAAL
jgi:hypothetical protein